ncbi:Cache 3/Cache 2 fusion domain-containing protein [Clostridium sp.]|uniref:Cache 3/Cache 2 fusion domain-containing protein n=1 Tax=Clostridium sp. TaxID=1506 RepID=UPI0032173900
MGIKFKLLINYLLLIIFTVSVLSFFIVNKSRDIVFNEVTQESQRITELIETTVSVRNDLLSEKIKTDLHFAEELLNNLGRIKIDKSNPIKVGNEAVPTLYAGNDNLNLSNSLVDDIKNSTGQISSIFLLKEDKLIRVSTNIIQDGKRVVGTYIDSDSSVYKKIINNEPCYGRFLIEHNSYIAGYKPILDENKKVIGAIGLGDKEFNNYLEKALDDIQIGQTGYVYIMNSKGDVIIHPHIKGQNIGEFDFSKKIINNKNGLIDYEFNGVHKLASYRYFEPWDWYIVTTANYDDLNSSSREIINLTFIAGIVIFILGVGIALFMANNLVRPINKLKNLMEIAGKGDLTVHSDINTKDEIGVLSDSFNKMIKENKRLLEEAVQYDKLKTEFIANISHELKTPLNIIFSTAQLFSLNKSNDKICNEKLNKYTDIIKQNCYRLIKLVNNLIDITKIDSGFMELNLKNQNIIEVIENITLSTVEYAQSKSRTIIFDTDTEEKILAFDSEKMERVILNLISNAIKFTNPGDKIEVSIYDKGDNILIFIKDTGMGIPEDKQKNIFERFKQVDPLLSRRCEGSGIGLSIVKSLVEMHSGNILVKSKLGEGSEFIIELPVKVVDEKNNTEIIDDYEQRTVEKIQIEFSDIYM